MIFKTTTALILVLSLIGCATPDLYESHPKIVFDKQSVQRPEYNRDFIDCDFIAKDTKTDVATNAIGGAAAGAGIGALTGLILGVDGGYGQLAGLGALAGGLSSAGGSVAYNSNRYKQVFVQCMRDRGYNAY